MSILWFDIETIPAVEKPPLDTVQAPANYKDPVKIAAYQEENVDKVWREQALNSVQGRLLCIGWADGNSPPVCRGIWDRSVAEVVSEFNDVVQGIVDDGPITWGGFNLRGFDLNWLYHRGVKYDLPALMDFIPRERFAKNILDVRDLWTGGDPYGKGKLKDIARFLGLPVMDDVDGGEVFDLYLAGEVEKIAAYCKHDVAITRAIAHRMGKGNPPVKPLKLDTFIPAAA